MMSNEEVAQTLEELARLLEVRKELIFKILSYRRAASAIRDLDVPLDQFRQRHDLQDIPGVGEAISKKVNELLDTGSFRLLEELRQSSAGKR
jgi:DNA polymerase (family X)